MSAIAGGTPERVTNDDVVELGGSWSPDGAWYAYRAIEGGALVLKKVRTTGQAVSQTVRSALANSWWLPVWSPDGDWIFAPHAGGDLVSADGQTTRDLKLGTAACAFAPGPEVLLHCLRGPQPDGSHELVAIDFGGAVVRTIGSLLPEHLPTTALAPGLRFSPTPGDQYLTYSIGSVAQNLWLMEGLTTVELP